MQTIKIQTIKIQTIKMQKITVTIINSIQSKRALINNRRLIEITKYYTRLLVSSTWSDVYEKNPDVSKYQLINRPVVSWTCPRRIVSSVDSSCGSWRSHEHRKCSLAGLQACPWRRCPRLYVSRDCTRGYVRDVTRVYRGDDTRYVEITGSRDM